jgi:hypothetical protein
MLLCNLSKRNPYKIIFTISFVRFTHLKGRCIIQWKIRITLGCDAMIRKLLFLLIGILVSSTVGCSWIEIWDFPKAKTADTGWVKVKFRNEFTPGMYKFQYQNINLIVNNSYYRGRSSFLGFIGPPPPPILSRRVAPSPGSLY